MSKFLEAALELAEAGIAVIPLKPQSKKPACPKGKDEATTDFEQIKLWDKKYPGANLGIVCGEKSGILGLDIDFKDGARADFLNSLPPTVMVNTSKGGKHAYFKYPGPQLKNGKKLEKGVTVRSEGYYFVGPPSIHPDTGQPYTWSKEVKGSLSDGEIAECPEWIINCQEWTPQKEEGGKEGTRHSELLRFATSLRHKGFEADYIAEEIWKKNESFSPPIDDKKEVEEIIKWAQEIKVPELSDYLYDPIKKEGVTCLGFKDDCHYYLSTSNPQLVRLDLKSHSKLSIWSLMLEEFWVTHFSKMDKEGNPKGVDYDKVTLALFQGTKRAGIFSSEKVRGVGAWNEDGKLVLNFGDHLLREKNVVPVGRVQGKHVYVAGKATEPLHPTPLEAKESSVLVDAIQSLNWKEKESAKYLLGWCAIARLGGALEWRPHCWLTGPSGSGKSTVVETIIKHICGDWSLQPIGNSTEAGVRQALGCDAIPVFFDEAESNDGAGVTRMQKIIELARQASSSSDARIMKGTSSQKGIQFKATSMFLFSSIRDVLIEEADKNRFTELELCENNPVKWPEIQKKLELIDDTYGQRLFSRMVSLWSEIVKSIAVFRPIISEVHGQRIGLHYATLLSGYWILTHDKAPTSEEAKELSVAIKLDRKEAFEIEKDSQACIQHLLSVSVKSYESAFPGMMSQDMSMVKLSRVIEIAGIEGGKGFHQNQLQSIGLKRMGDYLLVSNKDTELAKLFRDTKWGFDGGWKKTLNRLPGAQSYFKARIGGRLVWCTKVPVESIMPSSGEESDESLNGF